jgi:hypothetical protein
VDDAMIKKVITYFLFMVYFHFYFINCIKNSD